MIAQLKNASKVYDSPAGKMTVLDECTIEINQGELLLIIGPSGSGKTTLLSLLGCLINPTEGILEIDGKRTNTLSATEMAAIRLKTIGFVFQQFNLLAPLTAEGNIAFPLKMLGLKSSEIKKRTTEALPEPCAKTNSTTTSWEPLPTAPFSMRKLPSIRLSRTM